MKIVTRPIHAVRQDKTTDYKEYFNAQVPVLPIRGGIDWKAAASGKMKKGYQNCGDAPKDVNMFYAHGEAI